MFPDIGQNSYGGTSDFQISHMGVLPISRFLESLIKKNCQNSRTNNDIDMKFGPVTQLDKRNTATSKKFGDDVMSPNCDIIVNFPICGQFGAMWKPDSGRMVTLFKRSLTQFSYYCFE